MKNVFNQTNILASLIVIAGILRIIFVEEAGERFGETTLYFFFGAAAVFLLDRIKTFKYKDLEIELDDIRKELKETTLGAHIAQDASKLESTSGTPEAAHFKMNDEIRPGSFPDDPWKGVFGGNNLDKKAGRKLSAAVIKLENSPGWYSVCISVTGLMHKPALTGPVQFFLHDTFPNSRPVVTAMNNTATLNLKAWGAFTVGAVSDEGQCKLELDLAQMESAPREFREL
jgi:hypothetical protein